MIKVLVDEGVAFDMLSILQVKSKKSQSIQSAHNYFNFAQEIKDQVGISKMSEILDSPEYKNLVTQNEEVFEAVDLAKIDAIPASLVDKLNYQRYLAKKEIQKKFFGDEISEQKIGY